MSSLNHSDLEQKYSNRGHDNDNRLRRVRVKNTDLCRF